MADYSMVSDIRPRSTGLGASVFIVDDDDGIRRSLTTALTAAGYRTASSGSVDEFFSQFSHRPPTVILVDMRMPIGSGLDLLRRARNSGVAAPFVFLSGESSTEEAVMAMKEKAFDFLFKPVATTTLLETIEAAAIWDQDRATSDQQRRIFSEKLDTLTPREAELTSSIARNESIRNIALQFGISEATVKIHKARILLKLDSDSSYDLAMKIKAFKPELL